MIDPLSLGLALLLTTAKEVATSEVVKAAFSGIIGNRADVFLMSGISKVKEIMSFRNKEIPENHDLLRTLRKSMLTATDMVRLSMKEDGEQKQFRNKLKSWIDEQIKLLPIIENWADWNNPASDELELFFVNEKIYSEKKLLLTDAMTNSWEVYLQTQLQVELPKEFKEKLKNGWQEKDNIIKWDEAVMVLMIEALRDGTNEMGQRASKAFEHNFLSEIKIGLENVEKTTASIEVQISNVYQKMLTQFDNIEAINHLADTIHSQQSTIESQQLTIKKLVEVNEQLRDDKAKELSTDPDKLSNDETELLLYAYVNQKSIYTDMEPGYELLCVRCGGQYFGYEYTQNYINETNASDRSIWEDSPKKNPPNARIVRLHWLAVLESLIVKGYVTLLREKSYNKFYDLTVKGKLYADEVIQWRIKHNQNNIPKPSFFP
ncbi:hypothetical protein ACAW74_24470 [Fibrella sp. WM1]|uniref:hypothetical protein n=1 Tax=Fibrella musci TaxID=3242485 RepID=UPI003522FC6A